MLALQVAVLKGKGGVFTSLFHYARMWRENGIHSVCLYRGPGIEQLRSEGIEVIEAPKTLRSPLFGFLPDCARLRDEIRRHGEPACAMVHTDLALGAVKAMFPNAVRMTRCHSDSYKHKGLAQLIVTLNDDQQRRVQSALPKARVRMLGNPFVPAEGLGGRRGEAPYGRVRFNFLGRVEPVKQPLALVRAFCAADLPASAELRIIGVGSLDPEVRAVASGASRKIEQAGWKERAFDLFDTGDVLVVPSEWESYCWVVREALFARIPVIASDILVHRQVLGDGKFGWLFPVGDEEALRVLLERATTDKDRLCQMSQAGREALLAREGAFAFWRAMSAEIDALKRETRKG